MSPGQDHLSFLQGGGEMGGRIRAKDWTATPLGPPEAWPPTLRTLLVVMLGTPQPMFVSWGPDRIIIYNDGYAPMLGLKQGWALGRRFEEVWHDIIADVGPIMDRAYAGEASYADDLRLTMHRNGFPEEAYFVFSYIPIRDDSGQVAGMLCTCLETTRRVMAERRQAFLSELSNRLQQDQDVEVVIFGLAERMGQALSADRIGAASLDRDGWIRIEREWSAHRSSGLGEHRIGTGGTRLLETLRGQDMLAVGEVETDALMAEVAPQLLRNGVRAALFFLLAPEGRPPAILYAASGRARRWEEADLALFREVGRRVRGVEEHRQAAARLRESEERFREVADSAPVLIWAMDAGGGMTFLNRRFEITFGLPVAELREQDWLARLHPEDRERVRKSFGRAWQARRHYRQEVRVTDGAGRVRWFDCQALPRHQGEAFLGYLGTAADITEARLAADELERRIADRTAELRRAEEALRQSQKMEAIGQLTGGIAHDFNNLLQGIQGSLELAQRQLRSDRHVERFLEGAIASARRASSLTHRLLAFARRQPIDPRPVQANDLLASMADMLRRTIGEGIRLELDLAPDLWLTRCDVNQLENAILNLAINARDAMPDGGVLRLATRCRPGGGTHGESIVIGVSDTGRGMPPEVLEHAFEPFFTTKEPGRGTGLGLSMIYGFARQSGGAAHIESSPGQGTTVHLLLPRHHGVLPPAAAEAEAVPGGRGEVVAVVEDEPVVRALVLEVLADLGYEARVAEDGPGGLRLLREARRIDLLITDIGLPGLQGRRLAAEARRQRPGLPVLLMTGYAEVAASADGFLEPGMEMLTKPFAIAALARRVQAMLAGGRPDRPPPEGPRPLSPAPPFAPPPGSPPSAGP
ncbi:PAS domain S-box protein [Roseomonas sp. KE0001]|uniref:PAS domain S-box protein n=1 Tax=Roseomonas sp. KE0001 TaxID=2479201 RepID=UPI0018DFC411